MTATPVQPQERETWIQVKAEYEKALAIATQIWTAKHPPEVLNAIAATLLIHFTNLRRDAEKRTEKASRAERQAQGNGVQVPDGCPKCQDEMWDNRGDKKNPRSPDFKCKNPDCGHGIWLTPPPRRQGVSR
jgi:hypothetical protein